MHNFKTKSIKPTEVDPKWWIVDASQYPLGRLASQIAFILQGKNRPYYTPNVNGGDKVIIINTAKLHLKGGKMTKKVYLRHTGYPGGQKSTTPTQLIEQNHSERVVRFAIKRMLPKNRLQKLFIKNAFFYPGSEHKHQAQKPQPITLKS